MRVKDKVKIAFRNLIAGKQMIKKMVFGIMFIVMALVCFLTIVESYFNYMKKFNEKYNAVCYYYWELNSEDSKDYTLEKFVKESQDISKHYDAKELSILCTIESNEIEDRLIAGYTNIIIEENTYKAYYGWYNNNLFESIGSRKSLIQIGLYKEGMNTFPECITKSYEGDVLIGEFPNNPGEIMLDTYILSVFGIENIDCSLLGKNITIQYNSEDATQPVLKDYKISGILDAGILEHRDGQSTSDFHIEHIYANLLPEDKDRFYISTYSSRYYFNDFDEYAQKYEHMDKIMQFNGLGLENERVQLTAKGVEYCLLNWVMNNIGKLLLIISLIVGLIITVSVIYIFQFYKDRNIHYFAMLQNIGMTRRDRRFIFSVEMGVVMLNATVMGLYISAIFLFALNLITKTFLSFGIGFYWEMILLAIVVSWVYFGICLRIAMRKQ